MKIVIDIGGTKIKWGLLDKEYQIIVKGDYITDAFDLKAKGVIKSVANKCNELLDNYGENIVGVVISMPGAIDSELGRTLVPLNFIPGVDKINIREEFNKVCKLKVKLINDANAAALGEYYFGSLKGYDNSMLVTLGTGIGAGIIINGKIFNGHNFVAGEIGQHIVNGSKWENIASTRWLTISANFLKGRQDLSGEEILELAKDDLDIKAEYNKWMNNLAIGFANIFQILSPEVIAIGGGISENELFDIELLNNLVKENLSLKMEKPPRLVRANLGNDAALFGAGKFFDE